MYTADAFKMYTKCIKNELPILTNILHTFCIHQF